MMDSLLSHPSPVRATVDFNEPGVHHGHLRLPWSRNDSAWGNLMIPVTVITGAPGPTVLVTGGIHGDEYEGPLAILDAARRLTEKDIAGRLILLPFMNHPAVKAATRVSPIDGVNMNRCFPGNPDGSITRQIADYVLRALVPMASLVLDFHSGGKTLDFLPMGASHLLNDKGLEARCAAAAAAFNAPFTMRMLELDPTGLFDTAVESAGCTFVTTELRGGGTVTAKSAAVARRGLRNVLIHAGLIEGEVEMQPSTFLDMPSLDCYAFAQEAGMLEPAVDLGDRVRQGDLLARVWRVDRTGAAPEEVVARVDGILAARHFPGLVQPGDTVGVVAVTDG
jgi:N-alpha-acetyl-L-2,4-diaminobutyrate deacetylase